MVAACSAQRSALGRSAMPEQMTAAETVVQEVEAYFAKHGIRQLLIRVLVHLAKEMPAEPIRAARLYLDQFDAAEASPGAAAGEAQADVYACAAAQHSSQPPCLPASPAAPPPVPAQPPPTSSSLPLPSQKALIPRHDSDNAPVPSPVPVAGVSASLRPLAEPVEDRDVESGAEEVDPIQVLIARQLPSSKPTGAAPDPRGDDLSQRRQWAGGFNRALLRGWVKQPSPCCGAASTAGAINALWDRPLGSEGRVGVREVAELMAQSCDRQFHRLRTKLEGRLGLADGALDDFLVALDERIGEMGLSWTAGTGPRALTKKGAMKVVREVLATSTPQGEALVDPVAEWTSNAAQRQASPAAPLGEDAAADAGVVGNDDRVLVAGGRQDASVFGALRKVLVSTRHGASSKDAGKEADSSGAEGLEDADPSSFVATVDLGSSAGFAQQFEEMLHRRKGAMRLRAAKPNTAAVGSAGIKLAAEQLVASRGMGSVDVRTLLARCGSARAQALLSSQDDAAKVEQQWSLLKSAFGRPNSVLLFHLTNHYALVFAWREWCEVPAPGSGDGQGTETVRRQILTARKAQRPSAWIDFEEVRRIIIGWNGYNVLLIERTAGADASAACGVDCESDGLGIAGAHGADSGRGASSGAVVDATVGGPAAPEPCDEPSRDLEAHNGARKDFAGLRDSVDNGLRDPVSAKSELVAEAAASGHPNHVAPAG